MNNQQLEQMSWKVSTIKDALGTQTIRNQVLKKLINANTQRKGIIYGKTFGSGDYKESTKYCSKILQCLKDKQRKERYLIFTATNEPDRLTNETHFQSYIVDFQLKKLHIFDPARTKNGSGVYQGYVTQEVVIPKLQTEFECVYEVADYTPQTDMRDTFCQSWSLWMVIHFLNSEFTLPFRQKYKILYNFFIMLLNNFPSICKILKQEQATGYSCELVPIETETRAKFFLLENFET